MFSGGRSLSPVRPAMAALSASALRDGGTLGVDREAGADAGRDVARPRNSSTPVHVTF